MKSKRALLPLIVPFLGLVVFFLSKGWIVPLLLVVAGFSFFAVKVIRS